MLITEQFATEYFQWLLAIVNTRDRWKVYQSPQYPKTHRGQLSDGILMQAARAEIQLVFYSSGFDGCRWAALDPDKNLAAAEDNKRRIFEAMERARSMGLRPILFKNAPRSFHLINLFAKPQPVERVVALNRQLCDGWQIDVMPRSAADAWPSRWTALRMPGLHPKHGTYTQIWDGTKWVDFGTDEFLKVLRDNPPVENPQLPEAEPFAVASVTPQYVHANITKHQVSDCAWKKTEGPKMWGRIHRAALAVTSVDEFSIYLDGETKKIGCDECRQHFLKERADNPLPDDPAKLFEWTYDRHKAVRVKQKKSVPALAEAREKWRMA